MCSFFKVRAFKGGIGVIQGSGIRVYRGYIGGIYGLYRGYRGVRVSQNQGSFFGGSHCKGLQCCAVDAGVTAVLSRSMYPQPLLLNPKPQNPHNPKTPNP